MQTSLQGIANKARVAKAHRFGNLYRELNQVMLWDSWKYLNKTAASGVDRISAKEYKRDLMENIKDLVERLKRKKYRARLVRRKLIPKGKGKFRPLGIPVVEDKLLQTAVKRILDAIYEQDFLDCSYGYRLNRGPKEAAAALDKELMFGEYSYLVEADIKGYFNNINHEKLLEMMKKRINDNAFLRLIKKWLKAGVLLEDGKVENSESGSPQGGSISPILANIYLHEALDLWFEGVVKQHCRGSYLCRYADDFVVAFRSKRDAERFLEVLPKRLGKYDLELAQEKTRIIEFRRPPGNHKRFDFLGFEFRWDKSRKGKPVIKRRTSRAKMRKSLNEFNQWCRENRNQKKWRLFKTLNQKLLGYYEHYGIINNMPSLREYFYQAMRILFKWLNRRSQRRSYNWGSFKRALKYYSVKEPKLNPKPIKPKELQLCLCF